MTTKISRRDWLTSILAKIKVQDAKDVLFEKYSRKVFKTRVYQRNSDNETIADKNSGDLFRVAPVTSGLAPYTGAWTVVEALHLLKRTNFGFKKSDVDVLAALNFSDAVNTVLTINSTPTPPPVNFYQNFLPDQNSLPYGQTWVNNPFTTGDYSMGGDTNVQRTESLKFWNLGNLLNQNTSIKEKMNLFWYHFIPIDFETVRNGNAQYTSTNSARLCYSYLKLFSDNSTGNFKTLIRSIATHPAMMLYLNNQSNSNVSPDENFAREVMELFTLGKDPLSLYTEQDVIEAAKVLSGWRVLNANTVNLSTTFVPSLHNTGTKQFSAFFNNTVITNTGASELDTFIDMLFSKSKVVSEYICRRLYRFFVYYDIDATTETNIITPLALTFVANNWNIAPVLNQLFQSQHFFDMANRGVYIKSPYDVVLGTLRTFNLNYNVTDQNNFEAQYKLWKYFNDSILQGLEQSQGKMPNVSGWPAFYQTPSFHEYWINSSTTQKRFTFLNSVFNGFNRTDNSLTTRIEVDLIAFVQQFPPITIENPDLLVQECIKYLLPIDLSTNQKNTLKVQTLLSGQTTNYYWSDAWINYTINPTNTTYQNTVKSRLKALLVSITQLAEYQLM
jgi:uncharacterized protein (DUF1800 family)